MGVEIFEDLAPDGIDGAVAFVDDDEVKEFHGQLAAEGDGARRGGHLSFLFRFIEGNRFRFFFQLFIFEHGIEALDGADIDTVDIAGDVDDVIVQVADIVEFGEFTAVVGRLEVDEFIVGLFAQVVAIDQEEHTPRAGMFDQAVDEVNGRVGLAAARSHLDQGTRFVLGQGGF